MAPGDLYLRPPHITVGTAVAGCRPSNESSQPDAWRHADWLNRVSIANKQDFARLQGFRFMLIHTTVRP